MSVVAGEAAGGAHPGDSIRHAGEAGKDGLALEVPAGVGALLAVVAAQHQIRLLHRGFPAPHRERKSKAEHEHGTKSTPTRTKRIRRAREGDAGYRTSSSASMPSMYSPMVTVGSTSSTKASPPSRAVSAMPPAAAAGTLGRFGLGLGFGGWVRGTGLRASSARLERLGRDGGCFAGRGAEIEQGRSGKEY
jgi:hypothetical protein